MVEYLKLFSSILVLVTLIKLFVMWRRQQEKLGKIKNIPGPLSLPFIGVTYLAFGANLSEALRKLKELKRQYGKTVKATVGSHILILTSDADFTEKIIGNKRFVDRGEFMKRIAEDIFRDGLLVNTGETWKIHRKIISPLFHNNCLDNFVENFSKHSTLLADNLSKIPKETIFDTYSYALLCTLDIVTETIFGTKSKLQPKVETDIVEHYSSVMDAIGEKGKRPWLFIDFFFKRSAQWRTLKKSLDFIHNHVEHILTERKERYIKMRSSGKSSKIKYLFDVFFENGEVSQKEMMDEGINIMIAGSDTTATAFCFVLVALGEHQDVQEKVMEEQRTIFQDDMDRPVTSEDLHKMVYLEQVVKEVLRLLPPAPFVPRCTVEDLDLGKGFYISKGIDVVSFSSELHRDPRWFPDPERFDPDRFSPENSYGRHPYSYLPFGAGRRQCIGHKYAMMELKTMVSVVLRRIKIVRAIDGLKEIENHLNISIVLHSLIGYKIHIEPR